MSLQTLGLVQSMLNITTAAPADLKAFLALDPLMANLDTVIEAKVGGDSGNLIQIQFVADGTTNGQLTESAYPLIVYHFAPGVTTVTNFEADIAASTYLAVKTPGTGANIFASPGDVLAATNLAGGVDVGIHLKEGHEGAMRPAEYLVTAIVSGGPSDLFMRGCVMHLGLIDTPADDQWAFHNNVYGTQINGKLATALANGTHHFVVKDVGNYTRLWFTKSAGTVDIYVRPILYSSRGN